MLLSVKVNIMTLYSSLQNVESYTNVSLLWTFKTLNNNSVSFYKSIITLPHYVQLYLITWLDDRTLEKIGLYLLITNLVCETDREKTSHKHRRNI